MIRFVRSRYVLRRIFYRQNHQIKKQTNACNLRNTIYGNNSYSFANIINNGQAELFSEEQIGAQDIDSLINLVKNSNMIIDFPYTHIPYALILKYDQLIQRDSSLQDKIKDTIAFKCLINRKYQRLNTIYQILLLQNSNYQSIQLNAQTGQMLFNLYYEQQIQELILKINDDKTILQQKIEALTILSLLKLSKQQKQSLMKLDEVKIIKSDKTGILSTLYTNLLITHRYEYSHLLNIIVQKLSDDTIDLLDKIKISKIILRQPNFQDHFSFKIIEQCINCLTVSLHNMNSFTILIILRKIYEYKSSAVNNFLKECLITIPKMNIPHNDFDKYFFMPMLLKYVRLCAHNAIKIEGFLDQMISNYLKFKDILGKKENSRDFFMLLLFEKYKNTNFKEINPQFQVIFKDFFFQGMKRYSIIDQVEEQQLIKFLKMIIKFFPIFSDVEKNSIVDSILNKLLPRFDSSLSVVYFCIVASCRSPNPLDTNRNSDALKIKKQIKKYIKKLLEKYCSKTNNGDFIVVTQVNRVINLLYAIDRHQLDFDRNQLPKITGYDFKNSQEVLQIQSLLLFFTIFSHSKNQSPKEILMALKSLEPIMQIYFRKKKIYTFKSILAIIHVFHIAQYENGVMYNFIQNNLCNYLAQNQSFVISVQDLKFIKFKLINRGYGSQKFRKFIQKSIANPRQYKNECRLYIENEIQFQKKRKWQHSKQFNRKKQDRTNRDEQL